MEQDEFTRRRSCLSSHASDSHPAYLLLNVRQQSDMPGSLDGLSQRPLMLGAIATPAPWLDLAPIRDVAPQQGRIPVAYVFHLVSTESAYSPLRNVLRPGCSSHWSSCCIHHSSHPSLKREVLCPDLPVSLAFLYQRGHRWQPIKKKDALRYYLHLSMFLAVLAVPSPCS